MPKENDLKTQKEPKKPEYKSFELIDIKALPSEEDEEFFHFEGHAAVFGNTDEYNDIIEKGAFKESIAQKKPKLCYQHRWDQPLGIIDIIYEDEKGLYVKGRMPKDNTMCKDVASLIKCGAIDSFSIGYSTLEWEIKGDIRFLQKIKLWEVSFVTIPANDQATVTAIKSKALNIEEVKELKTKREFENVLRESGLFSKDASAYLASIVNLTQGEPEEQKDDENQPENVSTAILTGLAELKQLLGEKKNA